MQALTDPYLISNNAIRQPPTSLLGGLKFLGPGFILSASIVGSGELIATTVLGAKAGYAALWIIIVSCLAKVAVQLEFGRHAILTGETSVLAFNKLPGWRIGKANLIVWILLMLQFLKVVQIGGILGGTAVVLHLLVPGISVYVWAFVVAAVAAALVFNGRYGLIEKASLFMILMFTIFTVASLISVQFTEFAFSIGDVINGFRFRLTGEELAIAIGAFGITGVASDEIIAYNYWCLEKGYARFAGIPDGTPAWKQRAHGWINVMYLDAVVAMILYTLVTTVFYLLGAAILHGNETIPNGNAVIETLALIYTQSLGAGAKTIYLVGAFFVLFSSVYATLAYWTRVFPDLLGQLGWFDFSDLKKRKNLVSLLAFLFPFIWACLFCYIELPVLMVLSGGIIGSVMLLLVVFAGWHFKYGRIQTLPSGKFYNLIFWISVISIGWVAVYGLVQTFG
ncbi:MAG TPA: Nramp family divalent metal transporter [Cyclobacteriaceae bacterium]|nr:Nramp family divalent metal transporter [Cyclobacteriaceae bacterium]HPW61952.1 Nramp family divalent metal transporter [Cyclobacteriaceae bacterium]